jgi:membrane-associated phospholipid phosphatase
MALEITLVALAIIVVAIVMRFVCLFTWRAIIWAIARSRHSVGHMRSRAAGWGPIRATRERWPGPTNFLAARLRTSRFDGLPLTLITLTAVYLAFLFAGLVEEVFESEELLIIDQAIFDKIDPFRSPAVLAVFGYITRFGDMETLTAVTLIATAMLAVNGPHRFILPLWISVIGAQISSWAGKFAVDRPRPDFIYDFAANSPSFPSGHAASAVSIYLLLAYVLARDLKSEGFRFDIVYWFAVVALLVGLSRIVIGVHYPSDVAAGFLLGAFWIGVAVAVAELIKQHRPQPA